MWETKVKRILNNTRGLEWVYPILRQMGCIHAYHVLIKQHLDRARTKEERQRFREFCNIHADDFHKLYGMLEDDMSRKTLKAVINFRINWRLRDLKGITCGPQYFQKDIFGPTKDEVFVDGGAYDGDSVLGITKYFGNGKNYCKKIFAWEPEAENIEKLRKNLKGKGYKNLVLVKKGLWSEKTELSFATGNEYASRISDDGQIKIPVDSIDNLCSSEKVTFIKMDIEGSEKEALRGGEKVIKRDKPRLAICIYHSWQDLYQIAFMIKELVPEYKIYIRHHSDNTAETVLYATL